MPTEISRRTFAESLALGALAPLLGVPVPITPLLVPVPTAAIPAALDLAADEPGALAKALVEVVRVWYGSRLGEGDLATVARHIQGVLERAERVRRVELTNGDEPDGIFSAEPLEPDG